MDLQWLFSLFPHGSSNGFSLSSFHTTGDSHQWWPSSMSSNRDTSQLIRSPCPPRPSPNTALSLPQRPWSRCPPPSTSSGGNPLNAYHNRLRRRSCHLFPSPRPPPLPLAFYSTRSRRSPDTLSDAQISATPPSSQPSPAWAQPLPNPSIPLDGGSMVEREKKEKSNEKKEKKKKKKDYNIWKYKKEEKIKN